MPCNNPTADDETRGTPKCNAPTADRGLDELPQHEVGIEKEAAVMIPSNGLDPTMSHPRSTRTNLERRYLRMSSAPNQATHTVLTRRERESPMACRVVTRDAVGCSTGLGRPKYRAQ
jgi:hypothetical protein